MFKHIKNNKGFSLVELMVVVAIIGILAAIAIPTFTGFQKKARTAEGKNLLGSLYVAVKALEAEKGSKLVAADDLGLEALPSTGYYKVYGFDTSATLRSGSTTPGGDCDYTDIGDWDAGALPNNVDNADQLQMGDDRVITDGNDTAAESPADACKKTTS